MLKLHSCKTRSHDETKIEENEEYHALLNKVQCGNFTDMLQLASKQVKGNETLPEKFIYQEEFSLPLKKNIFGLFTIPISINHVPCTFIVDTGAQISGIKENFISKLSIAKTKGNLKIGSIGGTHKEMQGLCIDSLQLGAIEYRNQTMIALDQKDFSMRFGNIDLFGFDGILGWDILSELDFEMDDIAKVFKVLKNRFVFPYHNMIKGSFPLFLVKQQNNPLSVFGFDSGSKTSWLSERAIKTYDYEVVDEGSAYGYGVHGLEKMELKIVKEIELYLFKAKIELRNTFTGRTQLFDTFEFDGILGNEIFRGRRIRIINSKQMILIT